MNPTTLKILKHTFHCLAGFDIEQRRQFSSGGSFRPLFIIAGFLNILSKVSGKCA
jgi:hypothetical protein